MNPNIKSIISLEKTPNQVLKFLLLKQATDIQRLNQKLIRAREILGAMNDGNIYKECHKCDDWVSTIDSYACNRCNVEYCYNCKNVLHIAYHVMNFYVTNVLKKWILAFQNVKTVKKCFVI